MEGFHVCGREKNTDLKNLDFLVISIPVQPISTTLLFFTKFYIAICKYLSFSHAFPNSVYFVIFCVSSSIFSLSVPSQFHLIALLYLAALWQQLCVCLSLCNFSVSLFLCESSESRLGYRLPVLLPHFLLFSFRFPCACVLYLGASIHSFAQIVCISFPFVVFLLSTEPQPATSCMSG